MNRITTTLLLAVAIVALGMSNCIFPEKKYLSFCLLAHNIAIQIFIL